MEETIESMCEDQRKQVKDIEKLIRILMDHSRFKGEQAFIGQHSEMKANLMLTIRHLEDARMRLGKVIQYSGDGVSCYDK